MAWLKSRIPPAAAMTALVAALVAAVLEPDEFVAITETVIILPISPTTGV
jgi:hypothetical protein